MLESLWKNLHKGRTECVTKGLETCVGFSRNIEEYIVDNQIATHNPNYIDCNV